LISLDFQVHEIHALGMKILRMMVVVQFLTLVVFAWFNRVAWIRLHRRSVVPPFVPI